MELSVSIVEERNVFDDHLLDIIGNEFKFSHEKGLPEWIKNCVDAYLRRDPPVADDEQHIVLHFRDGRKGEAPIFECIDFCGMTSEDIDKALKRWGDPKAASRGLNRRVFGGHGNGGKFYMRMMFERSHFITYRNGKLNIFGFNEYRKYGFARGFKDKVCSAKDAVKLAGINDLPLPQGAMDQILKGETGFTVVRGIRPNRIKGAVPVGRLCEKVRFHPQARKIVQRKRIRVLHNGQLVLERLAGEQIELRPGFENLPSIPIPTTLPYEEDGHVEQIEFADKKYPAGQLKLMVAKEPFGRNSRISELNCIDILGEIGVIAWYRIHELPQLKQYAQAEFIFGECCCPILEDPDEDCVKNHREKLIDGPKTRALLRWIAEKVDEVGKEIEKQEAKERKLQNLKLTDEFNKILNTWKNQFMDKFLGEVLGGPGIGTTVGGAGQDGTGGGTSEKSTTKGGTGGEGQARGGGEGDQKKKGQSHPVVLLSSYNPDPFGNGDTLHLSSRHYPVYQRPIDLEHGVYWINTSRPLATAILERHGAESARWREYHFQRFVDIIVMEALHTMEKKGMELTFDLVENKINDVIKTVHDNALQSLSPFLL
ncbi:MAG: hypothetical protein LAO04_18230 [Acidobacteriia bacterium]|nr:hypothetical protein [Terriglobia bacterium]